MTKPTKWHVRPAKTQISLGIRPVWSESLLSTRSNLGSLATHWAHSEDSDQTGWMPRLIAPRFFKIQDKQRLFSVHFVQDRKHVYLFVLGFLTLCHFDWTVKPPVNQFSRHVNCFDKCETGQWKLTWATQLYVLSHDRSCVRGWDPVKPV